MSTAPAMPGMYAAKAPVQGAEMTATVKQAATRVRAVLAILEWSSIRTGTPITITLYVARTASVPAPNQPESLISGGMRGMGSESPAPSTRRGAASTAHRPRDAVPSAVMTGRQDLTGIAVSRGWVRR